MDRVNLKDCKKQIQCYMFSLRQKLITSMQKEPLGTLGTCGIVQYPCTSTLIRSLATSRMKNARDRLTYTA